MTENNINNNELSFRGPLKYVVETSAPQVEAGRNTTISLIITNPYDVPVKIISAQTKIPVEFQDSSQGSFWQQIWKQAQEETDLEQLRVVTGVNLGEASKKGEVQSEFTLQPGNTMIKEFRLKTRQWLFLTPAVHTLNAQVQYKMNGTINHDTVKYQLNIRAPLKALICGSVIGSICGTFLRVIKGNTESTFCYKPSCYLPFIAGILVGTVLVIAFSRKKDAQPFITIEDFWGGFFIGFIAGYVGESILDSVLPKI